MSDIDKDNERLETRYYKLEKLCKWEQCDKVNEMLLNGVSPLNVSKWCSTQGFFISPTKVADYRKVLVHCMNKDTVVLEFLRTSNVVHKPHNRKPIILRDEPMNKTIKKATSELHVLDEVIQRGFSTLGGGTTIRLQDALRAIELKNKLTKGGHGGLTSYGLQQLKKIEEAKFKVIIEIVCEYLTDEQQEVLKHRVAEAEYAYYSTHAPHLLEDYEQANEEVEDEYLITDDAALLTQIAEMETVHDVINQKIEPVLKEGE